MRQDGDIDDDSDINVILVMVAMIAIAYIEMIFYYLSKLPQCHSNRESFGNKIFLYHFELQWVEVENFTCDGTAH